MNWLDEFRFCHLLWYLLVNKNQWNQLKKKAPWNHQAKFGKGKSKTRDKKIPQKPEGARMNVARTVSRLLKSSSESSGGSRNSYAGQKTPNGCSRTREREAVFIAQLGNLFAQN